MLSLIVCDKEAIGVYISFGCVLVKISPAFSRQWELDLVESLRLLVDRRKSVVPAINTCRRTNPKPKPATKPSKAEVFYAMQTKQQ
jgi:hypothetical protein